MSHINDEQRVDMLQDIISCENHKLSKAQCITPSREGRCDLIDDLHIICEASGINSITFETALIYFDGYCLAWNPPRGAAEKLILYVCLMIAAKFEGCFTPRLGFEIQNALESIDHSFQWSVINTLEKSILIGHSFRIFLSRPTECLHLFAELLFDPGETQFKELIVKSEGYIMLALLNVDLAQAKCSHIALACIVVAYKKMECKSNVGDFDFTPLNGLEIDQVLVIDYAQHIEFLASGMIDESKAKCAVRNQDCVASCISTDTQTPNSSLALTPASDNLACGEGVSKIGKRKAKAKRKETQKQSKRKCI